MQVLTGSLDRRLGTNRVIWLDITVCLKLAMLRDKLSLRFDLEVEDRDKALLMACHISNSTSIFPCHSASSARPVQ